MVTVAIVVIWAGMAGTLGAGESHAAERRERVTLAKIEQLYRDVSSKSGTTCRVIDEYSVSCDAPADRTAWTFTRPKHPAHPAALRQTMIFGGNSVRIVSDGRFAGSESAFREWMLSQRERDAQALRGLTR